MKKSAQTFQIVAKERPGVERSSALYFYLEKFGIAPILTNQYVIGHRLPTLTREAFIFNLSLENTVNVFAEQGYQLVERHLRIDKKFNKMHDQQMQNLLSHWHYTENYTNLGREPIVVHMHFHHALMLRALMRRGVGIRFYLAPPCSIQVVASFGFCAS
jgi:hypothetical protein